MMRAPQFWHRRNAWSVVLTPLSWMWSGAGWARRRMMIARQTRAAIPVVSVGNLVAGGAGKTPIVMELAARLMAQGYNPHVITRGYGGDLRGPVRVDPARHDARAVGDEALLIASVCPVWVAARRGDAASLAHEAGADFIILDDAHQHESLAKDFSILVVDAAYGLGNGRVMPAGPLREGARAGLERADAIILMGEGEAPALLAPSHKPLFRARLAPARHAPTVKGMRILAFAGIARPSKFFQSLREAGAQIEDSLAFADHHPFSDADIVWIAERAKAQGLHIVTTAKDWVRLPPQARGMATVWPVVAEIETGGRLIDLILMKAGEA